VGQVSLLLSLFAVDMLAAMSPGPNFVLVTHTAVQRSRRHADAVVLGLVTANLIWCVAVALGLSALFALVPWLYRGIKMAGGAYLVYLGVQAWRSGGGNEAAVPAAEQGSLRSSYLRGLFTNLTNPKSAVYFGSIFVVFMGPSTPAWARVVAVVIVLFDTVLWYGAVGVLFSQARVRQLYSRARRGVNRVSGAVMALFGARLILARD
jgi:RhtB (resistance to homoserine/threonine) family protein